MPKRPEELHPVLCAAFNTRDLDGLLALYDAAAVFVIQPGRVTDGPAELRAALERLIDVPGRRLEIHPDAFVRSDDVVLAVGRYTLAGSRRDGTPFDRTARFADVLRRQPDGHWLIAVDNGFAGE